ncbi:class I SAM-dependent methyltransferase [Paenibacillus sp. MBLB4367]|uniref:class I SAM-dependent methyltransferase n=1 Tax=Paenibacillus sp. MBLB4367 TaxID=3384767 RepID=UPI003907F902
MKIYKDLSDWNMDDELTSWERVYSERYDQTQYDHLIRYHFAIPYIPEGVSVLDVACGSGYGTSYVAHYSKCRAVIGIDRSDHALEWARTYYPHEKAAYVKGDLSEDFAEQLPIRKFEIITCFETVEHMQDDKAFVAKLYDLLVPGGALLISAPNEDVIPHLDNYCFPERINPHHFRHYRPLELEQLLTNCGFRICERHTQTVESIIHNAQHGFVTILVATR